MNEWKGIIIAVVVVGAIGIFLQHTGKEPQGSIVSEISQCVKVNPETVQFTGSGFAGFDANNMGRLCVWQDQEKGWVPYVMPEPNSVSSTKR